MSLCLFILTDFCRLRILRHKHVPVLPKVLDLFLVPEQSLFLPLPPGHSVLSMKALHGSCPEVASSYNFLQFLAAPHYVDNNAPATLCHTVLTIMPRPTTSYHLRQAPMTAICSAPICSPVPDVQTGLHCVPCPNISTISLCTGLRHPTSTSPSSFSTQCCRSGVEVYKFL